MILPGNLPASTAPPGLEQAEIGLKRKRAGAAKYKQGREVSILRRLALEIYSYIGRVVLDKPNVSVSVICLSSIPNPKPTPGPKD